METLRQKQFSELSFYTLEHPDKQYFIHQHIVDAYAAQNADENSRQIAIVFSLAGLYLFLEKNYSGRKVQLAHMKLVKSKKVLPSIKLPDERGEITVSDVLASSPGKARDLMIKIWCQSVWKAYSGSHEIIAAFIDKELFQKATRSDPFVA